MQRTKDSQKCKAMHKEHQEEQRKKNIKTPAIIKFTRKFTRTESVISICLLIKPSVKNKNKK